MLNVAALLIPVFFILIAIEAYFSYKQGDHKYNSGNTTLNIAIGAIDQVCSLFYYVVMYLVLKYTYEHFRLFELSISWYHWLLAFIAVDFLSYWYHRISHEVNIFWAGHITHHSSEKYNFSVSFRVSIFQGINRILFWAFLPVLGFSPDILILCFKISGVYQFFLHTEYIGKLGFWENILVTPSIHRVHHGKNDIYLDKNYGSFFIIWDKLFGTFQKETEPVEYGIKGDYEDNHPIVAIGHHYIYLWQTMKNIPSWKDKFKLLIMPPAWTPQPLQNTSKISKKVNHPTNSFWKTWSIFQIVGASIGIIALLVYKDFVSTIEIITIASILLIAIVQSAKILNNNMSKHFIKKETIRLIIELIPIAIVMAYCSNYYLLLLILFHLSFLITLFWQFGMSKLENKTIWNE